MERLLGQDLERGGDFGLLFPYSLLSSLVFFRVGRVEERERERQGRGICAVGLFSWRIDLLLARLHNPPCISLFYLPIFFSLCYARSSLFLWVDNDGGAKVCWPNHV
jgi:hypothetical protein